MWPSLVNQMITFAITGQPHDDIWGCPPGPSRTPSSSSRKLSVTTVIFAILSQHLPSLNILQSRITSISLCCQKYKHCSCESELMTEGITATQQTGDKGNTTCASRTAGFLCTGANRRACEDAEASLSARILLAAATAEASSPVYPQEPGMGSQGHLLVMHRADPVTQSMHRRPLLYTGTRMA